MPTTSYDRNSLKQAITDTLTAHGVDTYTNKPAHILAEIAVKIVEAYHEADKAVHEFFGTTPPGSGQPGDGSRPISTLSATRPPGSLRMTGLVANTQTGNLVPAGNQTASASNPVGAMPGDAIVDNHPRTAEATAAALNSAQAGIPSDPALKSYEHPTAGSGYGDSTNRQPETPVTVNTKEGQDPATIPLDPANQNPGQATEVQRMVPGGEQLETDTLPTGAGDYLFTGKCTAQIENAEGKTEDTQFDMDHTPLAISKKGDNSGFEAKYARVDVAIPVDAEHFDGKWQFVEPKVAEQLPGAVPKV